MTPVQKSSFRKRNNSARASGDLENDLQIIRLQAEAKFLREEEKLLDIQYSSISKKLIHNTVIKKNEKLQKIEAKMLLKADQLDF